MATTYSSHFSSAGVPTTGRPFTPPVGLAMDAVTHTIPTTMLDTIGDFTALLAIPIGKTLMTVEEIWADLGSGELDADLIYRTVSSAGVATDTIVVNHGTALATAQTTFLKTLVNAIIARGSSATDYAYLGYLVNVAAVTPIQGEVQVIATWR